MTAACLRFLQLTLLLSLLALCSRPLSAQSKKFIKARSKPESLKSDSSLSVRILQAQAREAQSEKLKDALPAPIVKAFERAYPAATLAAVEPRMRYGNPHYQLTALLPAAANGSEYQSDDVRDLLYSEDGALVERSESIEIIDLPEDVKETVEKQLPKSRIEKARKVISDKPTEYEITARKGKQLSSLSLDAQGNILRFVDTLPVAVQASLERIYPNASLTGFMRDDQSDKECYRVECKDGDAVREVLFFADGEVLEVKENIAALALPEAVKETVQAQYGEGKIASSRRKVRTEYEVLIKDGKDTTLLVLDATGRLLVDTAAVEAPSVAEIQTPNAPAKDSLSTADSLYHEKRRVVIIRHFYPRPFYARPAIGYPPLAPWGFFPRPFISPRYHYAPRFGYAPRPHFGRRR